MEPIKKIFVSLDMSEMDALLVRAASFIANSSSAEHVYFCNVVRNFSIPSDVKKEFPNLEKNAIQERIDKIKEVVDANFECDKDIKIECLASPGQTGVVLNLANKYQADLLIVGQKKTLAGTGVLAQRLARRASCNLFIIPEGSEPGVKKILVPIDFSKYSKLAMGQAIEIARRNGPDVEIVCQNVYSVPAGYHYTGKTFDEFAEVMKKHAEKDFDKFIKDINTHGVKISTV
ncbi:MAG: universal stress protein, partial [Bacteroidota bacterium]